MSGNSPNAKHFGISMAEPIYAIPIVGGQQADTNANIYLNSADISSASLYSMDETIERSGNLFSQVRK